MNTASELSDDIDPLIRGTARYVAKTRPNAVLVEVRDDEQKVVWRAGSFLIISPRKPQYE